MSAQYLSDLSAKDSGSDCSFPPFLELLDVPSLPQLLFQELSTAFISGPFPGVRMLQVRERGKLYDQYAARLYVLGHYCGSEHMRRRYV